MSSEHNPIAELIHQIQQKWMNEVSPFPDIKLARWLIKPEQARLFEGFLKLESTEHGAIPEVLVAMLTPFKNEFSYSLELIQNWSKAFKEDAKTREKLQAKEKRTDWNPALFAGKSKADNGSHDGQLLQMLASFQKDMMDSKIELVVALFPHSINNMDGFRSWLTGMLKIGIPPKIRFMVFDHLGEFYFDKVCQKNPDTTKSLRIDLDLDGAVSKIAKMGNPNAPEVQLRECILEMGQALQKNNVARLHEWGEKALKVGQKSGLKSMYASAHIIYAGMLFSLKEFNKIDPLLTRGLAITKLGMATEEAACKPLLIQFYGYIASSNQLQKKMPKAIAAFEKQGDTATEYQLPAMALMPYRQAYILSKKSLPQRYDALLQKAFAAGRSLKEEEQKLSCFASVGLDFMLWQQARQLREEAAQTEKTLRNIFGSDWIEKAKKPNLAYASDKSVVAS